jgi:hypothetical protein
MVIDDRIVVAGSFKLHTTGQRLQRREPVRRWLTAQRGGGIEVEADPVKDIAVHVRKEIRRLFDLSAPFVPGNPP